jgi:sugar O-acyltransferase (sialic acid O-acetyltransferase NeuD family)
VIKEQVILQGGGEHAKVVLDCLQALGADVIGIFDPKYDGELLGVKQLGQYNSTFESSAKAIVAIGDNALRKKVADFTQHAFTNAIHPSCVISSRVHMGKGNMILHGAIIQADTHIGHHVIINTGASIDHDCEIADYVHIAPRAVLCGRVKLGEGVMIGAGAVILPGVHIADWAIVGAGSVVTKNVAAGVVVKGNPAR